MVKCANCGQNLKHLKSGLWVHISFMKGYCPKAEPEKELG